MRRVAITGLGCVTPFGIGAAPLSRALLDGASAIRPARFAPAEDLQIGVAAEVPDFDVGAHFPPKQAGMMDRFAQFGVLAAREAWRDAGLAEASNGLKDRTAVVVGTGCGGKTADDAAYRRLYGEGEPRVHPLTTPRVMASAATSHITMDLGLRGPAFGVTSACASAAHALGQALGMVRQGQVDVALAGGAEACLALGLWRAWEAMRVMAPDACRPFSRGRRGMTLGEGAAIVALEPLEAARARGATVYAELAGFGMSADASHIVEPSADGAARAISAALADAKLVPEEVGYINAHGTGTAANDATETRAVRDVFGVHAEKLVVSSTKSMIGHALGASGALELVATLLAFQQGMLPPTVNYLGPDPACDLDCAPNEARRATVGAALSSSFAFGGLNAVLALRNPAA